MFRARALRLEQLVRVVEDRAGNAAAVEAQDGFRIRGIRRVLADRDDRARALLAFGVLHGDAALDELAEQTFDEARLGQIGAF